jgi:hypothetical protein
LEKRNKDLIDMILKKPDGSRYTYENIAELEEMAKKVKPLEIEVQSLEIYQQRVQDLEIDVTNLVSKNFVNKKISEFEN